MFFCRRAARWLIDPEGAASEDAQRSSRFANVQGDQKAEKVDLLHDGGMSDCAEEA
jgi:hypothetical protein